MIGALSYGELAGMMPHAGGQYVYLRESWNPLIAFLYGWTLFLVIQTGTIAAVAVPLTLWFYPGRPATLVFAVGVSLLIVWAHRANLKRLAAGTENRVRPWKKSR